MDTNVKSMFLLCKYSIPHSLRNRKGGAEINISSDLVLSPIPSIDGYAASKGAMIALSKAMSKNRPKKGNRVNCIAPRPIDTPLLHRFIGKDLREFVMSSLIPMDRLGKPEEIARITLFLASGDSWFVIGAIFTVNGGLI